MSGNGLLQTSTLGMRAQAQQLNTIGYNIANVNAGGFKRLDTQFQTLLSKNQFQNRDLGGVIPYSRATNDIQGRIQQSASGLDLAIVGHGFFAVQPTLNDANANNVRYTRDGAFGITTAEGQTSEVTADDGATITVSNGYLTDKNGMYLRGIPISADGTFGSADDAQPMRVDQYAFVDVGKATTASTLKLNLPANQNFGDTGHPFTMRTYDTNGTERNVTFSFSRTPGTGIWRVDTDAENLTENTLSPGAPFSLTTGAAEAAGATELSFDTDTNTVQVIDTATGIPVGGAFGNLAAGDEITLAGTAGNNRTFIISSVNSSGSAITLDTPITAEPNTGATPATVTSTATITENLIFSEFGALQSPNQLTYTATWSDGATSEFTIDISEMTQLGDRFALFGSRQDGLGNANLGSVSFNTKGEVIGRFSDGTERSIYKIPLYDFINPNGLESENGLLFAATGDSGPPAAFFADESGQATFLPQSQELSNVDIATEFSRMIQTQSAYNMNATSFKAVDEMLTVARDLKA